MGMEAGEGEKEEKKVHCINENIKKKPNRVSVFFAGHKLN
jgi:hypothetical protein